MKTGRAVDCAEFDALVTSEHAALWASIENKTDAVLCAVGLLGDQTAARHDTDAADRILRVNFTGLVPLLSMAADTFEQRQSGLIIGISSVAGDRGRGSNYLYGSAKAGFSAFLSGLRVRLAPSGVQVLTVKPGLVASPMLEGVFSSPRRKSQHATSPMPSEKDAIPYTLPATGASSCLRSNICRSVCSCG